MGHNEDKELVPLKADFDSAWYGFRRSQVRYYVQQTEAEMRMLSEDRDSALSQVTDLSEQLDQARAEIDTLRKELDAIAKTPVEEGALSDRMRRMVLLARSEAEEIVSSAQAAAEHEWARSEQQAAELRARYERLVAEADEWRKQSEVQRNQALARTREEIQQMMSEAEQRRRQLDTDAEQRRTQVETDFEISMAARREEAMRIMAEREHQSRTEAQRRVHEANQEASRRLRRADEYNESMLRMRQGVAERIRTAQRMLAGAQPFLTATEAGVDTEGADAYVAETVHGQRLPLAEDEVAVPKQRDTDASVAETEVSSDEAMASQA